jgi:hypothetical protein
MSSVRGSRFHQIMRSEYYMRKAQQQITVLDIKLLDLQKMAEKSKQQGFPLVTARLNRQINIVEGVRSMYFEYILAKTEEISVPSRDLYDEDVISTMAIDNDDFMFNE